MCPSLRPGDVNVCHSLRYLCWQHQTAVRRIHLSLGLHGYHMPTNTRGHIITAAGSPCVIGGQHYTVGYSTSPVGNTTLLPYLVTARASCSSHRRTVDKSKVVIIVEVDTWRSYRNIDKVFAADSARSTNIYEIYIYAYTTGGVDLNATDSSGHVGSNEPVITAMLFNR